MPYRTDHKAGTREKIVASARRLFNARGFSGVSIDEIMAGAGLTRGGFYSHFATKDELYAEAIKHAVRCEVRKQAIEAKTPNGATPTPHQRARRLVEAYLSSDHLAAEEYQCPLMALSSDVARETETVRDAFQTVFVGLAGMLEDTLCDTDHDARQRAIAISALLVGSMSLARAIPDTDLADEIRAAARSLALEAGQWSECELVEAAQ